MRHFALVSILVASISRGEPASEAEEVPASTGAAQVRGALEVAAAVLPSGFAENQLDGFLSVQPIAALEVGDVFEIELGPTFRLRLIDLPPVQHGFDYGGILRRPDWDETSDFGQIVQLLRIGSENTPASLFVGATRKKTLGLGHLISRYSNIENTDYHPAAATGILAVGPIRVEAFASDVLGARIFAGDIRWDIGATFSQNADWRDRLMLAFEAAHDAAIAGRPIQYDPLVTRTPVPSATLFHTDFSAVVLRSEHVRLMLLAGAGVRANADADLGFVVGGMADVTAGRIGVSAKAELRKQAGRFRQGFFGPSYELSRFADIGLGPAPIANASLPDSFSAYGELRVGVGEHGHIDLAIEHFFTNRTDFDVTASLNLVDRRLAAFGRLTGVGIGQSDRFSAAAGLRVRAIAALYAFGSVGLLYIPQPDLRLVPGLTGTLGVGVDFES